MCWNRSASGCHGEQRSDNCIVEPAPPCPGPQSVHRRARRILPQVVHSDHCEKATDWRLQTSIASASSTPCKQGRCAARPHRGPRGQLAFVADRRVRGTGRRQHSDRQVAGRRREAWQYEPPIQQRGRLPIAAHPLDRTVPSQESFEVVYLDRRPAYRRVERARPLRRRANIPQRETMALDRGDAGRVVFQRPGVEQVGHDAPEDVARLRVVLAPAQRLRAGQRAQDQHTRVGRRDWRKSLVNQSLHPGGSRQDSIGRGQRGRAPRVMMRADAGSAPPPAPPPNQ